MNFPLDSLRDSARGWPRPDRFGSVARGEDSSGSDLDLLVSFARDADIFDLADLIAELETITELQVDIVSEGPTFGTQSDHDEAIPL